MKLTELGDTCYLLLSGHPYCPVNQIMSILYESARQAYYTREKVKYQLIVTMIIIDGYA